MLTAESIRKKLEHLQPSQESVETVSLWCLHHKDSAALIVSTWIQIFKSAATDKQRLALFYLANDVCQKARKKKAHEFLTVYVPALKEALLLSRSESNRQSIERILKIWGERSVFDGAVIKEFQSSLEASKSAGDNAEPIVIAETQPAAQTHDNEAIMNDFSLSNLIAECERYQKHVDAVERLRVLLPSTSSLATDGNVKGLLKSRQEGQRFIDDMNQTHKKWTEFADECDRRLKRHHQLVIALERAQIFYEIQMKEAGIVQTAYEKFGSGVKNVRDRVTKMQKLGNYNYLSVSIDTPSPTSSKLESGSGSKRDADIETVDMDLDDDVKFPNLPNLTRSISQEAAIGGMKLATNQSFLNDPPPAVASNGAKFEMEPPSKKPKLDPRQQVKAYPATTGTDSPHSHYAPSTPTVIPTTPSWPSDLSGHYSPPVNAYPPNFGQGQPPAPMQSPYLSQPPPQVHYQMQSHSTYGGVLPPPPPPPPPPQPMPVSSYGAANLSYPPPTTSTDTGTVFDYDHGNPGNVSAQSPHLPAMGKNRGGSNMNNLTVLGAGNDVQRHDAPPYPNKALMDNRAPRFHPPDPQYYDGYGNSRAAPSTRHYSPMNRGHFGRGGGRY